MPQSNEYEGAHRYIKPDQQKDPTIEMDQLTRELFYEGSSRSVRNVILDKLRINAAIKRYRNRFGNKTNP